MGILKRMLPVLGILLCVYPFVSQMYTRNKNEEIVQRYRKASTVSNIIGILEIPKINVLLPIYQGTTEEVLEKGIGHLDGSSALGGGMGTHCLLAGHRGLPEAELFTRLGEVEEGELFYIEENSRRYIYQVCEIRVVRSEETEGLGIQEDRDLVSLITCTPYGINTHRLIVTGERMEEKE